jgi:hypothetical protein
MRRVNMQSLGITEVYVNTLALLDINSPKNDCCEGFKRLFFVQIKLEAQLASFL